MMNVK